MTTRATAAAELEVVRVAPPGGATYTYRLPVPRGWHYGGTVGRALELDTIARPLGTFVRPDRAVSITVAVTPLPIEVRLEDWIADELTSSGWQVDEMGWHRVAGVPKLAVIARREGHVRASAAIADGGRLYEVHVQGRNACASEVVDRLWWSAMAFVPCRPGGPGRLEARQRISIGSLGFAAPISWAAAEPRDARVQLLLRHPSGVVRGRLIVRAEPTTPSPSPVEARREAALAALRARGLVLARTLEQPEVPWRGLPTGWELRTCAARDRGGAQVDLVLVHGVCAGIPVELTGLGSRATARSWMRTTRALEIACETLRAAETGRPERSRSHARRFEPRRRDDDDDRVTTRDLTGVGAVAARRRDGCARPRRRATRCEHHDRRAGSHGAAAS